MDFERSVLLIIFLAPLAYSPGPGNMFFAANGARFGWRATLMANFGYHSATWLVTMIIGLAYAGSVAQVPVFFAALKLAGSVYVLWLAYKMIRAGVLKDGATATAAGFRDGVLLLLFNPKAYLIIGLMFSQFLDAEAGAAAGTQMGDAVWIATVFTLNNLIAFLLWSAAGDAMARKFRKQDSAQRLNLFFGALLAAVAIWMLFV